MTRYLLIIICLLTLFPCNSKSKPNSKSLKVLFIGNSYTYNNDLSGQIKAMTEDHLKSLHVTWAGNQNADGTPRVSDTHGKTAYHPYTKKDFIPVSSKLTTKTIKL